MSFACFFFCSITFEKDKKLPNSGTFRIVKEDHTLGHLLQMFAQH